MEVEALKKEVEELKIKIRELSFIYTINNFKKYIFLILFIIKRNYYVNLFIKNFL
jgi:hypothetical protein